MSLTLYQTSPRLGGVGFSLVECLIANALILVMISALISASVDVAVAAQRRAKRSKSASAAASTLSRCDAGNGPYAASVAQLPNHGTSTIAMADACGTL